MEGKKSKQAHNIIIYIIHIHIHVYTAVQEKKKKKKKEVPPRLEHGSLDSKSRVLTITPWDHVANPNSKLLYL